MIKLYSKTRIIASKILLKCGILSHFYDSVFYSVYLSRT